MAPKSLNASLIKFTFVLLIFTTITTSLAMARTIADDATAAPKAGDESDSFLTEEFSLFRCVSFVSEATKCVIDVIKKTVAPHPSCCKAISKLNECSSSSFLKGITSDEFTLIQTVCALWGVSIS